MFLGANADDHLPLASLGRVEGSDGIVEGCGGANIRPESSVPHSLHDLTQLGAIGLDDEINRQAINRPRFDRADNGYQCSTCLDQARGPLLDVATDDIEDQIDSPDVFQRIVLQVDELMRPEVESL